MGTDAVVMQSVSDRDIKTLYYYTVSEITGCSELPFTEFKYVDHIATEENQQAVEGSDLTFTFIRALSTCLCCLLYIC